MNEQLQLDFNQPADQSALEAERLQLDNKASQSPEQAWMGGVNGLNPQSMRDMADYIETRPYNETTVMEGAEGKIGARTSLIDPKAGQTGHDYFDNKREDHYEETAAETPADQDEDLTPLQMTEKWALAEEKGDKRMAEYMQDQLLERLIKDTKLSDDEKVAMIDKIHAKKDDLKSRQDVLQGLGNAMAAKIAKDSAAEDEPFDVKSEDVKWADDGELPEIKPLTTEEEAALDAADLAEPKPLTPEEEAALDAADAVEESPEEKAWMNADIKLPKNLQVELSSAREEFIKLSAKRRGISFGHKRKLAQAKERYDQARNAAGQNIADQLRANEADNNDLLAMSKVGALTELAYLTEQIKEAQVRAAGQKHFSGFYDRWARWGGKGNHTGKIKKIAAMGVITFLPGVGLAVAGAALLGPVAGAAIGGAIARGVGKGLASGHINRNANAKRVAEVQAAQQQAKGESYINRASRLISSEGVSNVAQELTDRSNSRNKRRLIGGVALGAAMGAAGAVVGDLISDNIQARSQSGRPLAPDLIPGNDIHPTTAPPLISAEEVAPTPHAAPPLISAEDAAPAPNPAPPLVDAETLAPAESAVPAAPAPELPQGFGVDNWPWANAETFNTPNAGELVQRTLDEYNARTGNGFVWNHNDGMFWEGDHVMNPAELAEYNSIMAEVAARAAQTLPETE